MNFLMGSINGLEAKDLTIVISYLCMVIHYE